jgi:hypothetical protein
VSREGEDFFLTRAVVRVPGVREDAGEAQIACVADATRDIQCLWRVRLDAAAVIAAIYFEKKGQSDTRATRRFIEWRGNVSIVRDEREPLAPLCELNRLPELAGLDWHGVGDIREAAFGEPARLGERGDRQRAGKTFCL